MKAAFLLSQVLLIHMEWNNSTILTIKWNVSSFKFFFSNSHDVILNINANGKMSKNHIIIWWFNEIKGNSPEVIKLLQSDESCYNLWVFHVIRRYHNSVISIGWNNGKFECCTGRLSEIFVLGINLALYHGMMQYMRFPSKSTERTSGCTLSSPPTKFTPLGIGIKELSNAGQLSMLRQDLYFL